MFSKVTGSRVLAKCNQVGNFRLWPLRAVYQCRYHRVNTSAAGSRAAFFRKRLNSHNINSRPGGDIRNCSDGTSIIVSIKLGPLRLKEVST